MKKTRYAIGIVTFCIVIFLMFRFLISYLGGTTYSEDELGMISVNELVPMMYISTKNILIFGIAGMVCGIATILNTNEITVRSKLLPMSLYAISAAAGFCTSPKDITLFAICIWYLCCALFFVVDLIECLPKQRSTANAHEDEARIKEWVLKKEDVDNFMRQEEVAYCPFCGKTAKKKNGHYICSHCDKRFRISVV